MKQQWKITIVTKAETFEFVIPSESALMAVSIAAGRCFGKQDVVEINIKRVEQDETTKSKS